MSQWVRGEAETIAAMEQVTGAIMGGLTAAMDEVRAFLEEKAKNEHPWKDESGDTRENTTAALEMPSPLELAVVVRSVMTGKTKGSSGGASYWLEMTRGGKWAWLYDSVFNSQQEIMEILASHGLAIAGRVDAIAGVE